MSAETDKQRQQRVAARQARAMTRAIDKVSEEFIENFVQTGIDDGPDQPTKLSPVRQTLADREAREAKEAEAAKTSEPEFRGFASLMANANRKSTGEFSRILESESPYIKVRETVGKKRGLYTSCMQRPDAAQMEKWAAQAAAASLQAPVVSRFDHEELASIGKSKTSECALSEAKSSCAITSAFFRVRAYCHKLLSRWFRQK